MLYYDLNDNSWCAVRPSGTEPKIKFYMGVKGKSMEEAEKKTKRAYICYEKIYGVIYAKILSKMRKSNRNI